MANQSEDDDFPKTYEDAQGLSLEEFHYNPTKMIFNFDFVGARAQPCGSVGDWCLIGNWRPDGTRRIVYCNELGQCQRGVIYRRGQSQQP